MDLHSKKHTARRRWRKEEITAADVAHMNGGDNWHGACVAALTVTALRPFKSAGARAVKRALSAIAVSHPSLHMELEQPTPEEYFVGHLWCVRVPGTPDNLEELVTKHLLAEAYATGEGREKQRWS